MKKKLEKTTHCIMCDRKFGDNLRNHMRNRCSACYNRLRKQTTIDIQTTSIRSNEKIDKFSRLEHFIKVIEAKRYLNVVDVYRLLDLYVTFCTFDTLYNKPLQKQISEMWDFIKEYYKNNLIEREKQIVQRVKDKNNNIEKEYIRLYNLGAKKNKNKLGL